jgi:hypothetical protein
MSPPKSASAYSGKAMNTFGIPVSDPTHLKIINSLQRRVDTLSIRAVRSGTNAAAHFALRHIVATA